MHRIDGAGNASGQFVHENYETGRPPTEVTADWLNAVQAELLNVIEAGGIAPNKADSAQLLAALRGAGIFTTPAQFDNSRKVATTEFVQRAIGGFSRLFGYGTAGQTIPPDQANAHINVYGTCSSITLPLARSVPAGSVIEFGTASLMCTINRQGADRLFLNATNDTASALVLSNGGSARFVSDGMAMWFATGVSTLKYSDEFAASLTQNGYRFSPDGSLEQWGYVVLPGKTGGEMLVVPLHIAYPTDASVAHVSAVLSSTIGAGGASIPIVITSTYRDKSSIYVQNTSTRAENANISWRVVGKWR